MLIEIAKAVNATTFFMLVILVYVVITSRQKQSRNLFIIILLSLIAFLVLIPTLDKYGLISLVNYPIFELFNKALFLFIGPLVYMHTQSVCYRDFKLDKFGWVHFVPGVLVFVWLVTDYNLRASQAVNPSEYVDLLTYSNYNTLQVIFLFLFLGYIIFSFIRLRSYKSELKSTYSYVEKINLDWLSALLVVLFGHWVFDALFPVMIAMNLYESDLFTINEMLSISSLLIFCSFVVVKGMKQTPVLENISDKPKYADSNLSMADCELYANKLAKYMEREKPYLNSSLKISDLADNLSLPAKSLSQVINQKFGDNFFDFINKYRIAKAKEQLINSNGNHKTISEILYESGFNSKAAFNRAFKKHTGITPSRFKSLN